MGDGRAEWIDAWLSGDRRALSRALTVLEHEGPEAPALLAAMRAHCGKALSIGFTGPPGAGKSTLVDAFVGEQRRRGRGVGVLAVDPSSPVSGGAILGDRIRMTQHAGDAGVFVRSLASGGHLGGLSRGAVRVMAGMDAAGFDIIVLETVGAGQSEVEIAGIADITVMVAAPGLGDEVQAIKAGILEIADLLVVNKGDHPLAAQTARHLALMSNMRPVETRPPVLTVTALTGAGVGALADKVDELQRSGRAQTPLDRGRRLIRRIAIDRAAERIDGVSDAELASLADAWRDGELSMEEAVERLLERALETRK